MKFDKVGRNITRLDLRQVKNIIDQLDEVITAAMDSFCVADLLFTQVAIMILI